MNTTKSETAGAELSAETNAILDRVVAIRRQVHAHPELAHQEFQTQKLVLDTLGAAGVSCRPMADTGVVGVIEGKRGPGKVLLLRADMDALPIVEESDVEYCSERPGVMHACGHDAHTATLLGAALILARNPDFAGTVKLMFQPAEEGAGGAQKMLDAGILESPNVDASLALHVWSGYDFGEIVVREGPLTASVDDFEIEVTGKGVHAAIPEDGVDPIVVAAQIVVAGQALVGRRTGAFEPSVLSFTQFQGGTTFNVIPPVATLRGTIRTLDERARTALKQGLGELVSSLPTALGAHAELRFVQGTGVTNNDGTIIDGVGRVARRLVGDSRVIAPKPLMVGEDIGLVQQRVPGALVLLGCRNAEAGICYPHHHPQFDIDERVLGVGVELFTSFVNEYLG